MKKLLHKLFLFAYCQLFTAYSFSQIGGTSTYNFLKIPSSARSAALGGNMIAVNDSDIALVVDNPSLLNAAMHNNFTLSYINYLSDINLGYAGYARNFKTIGTVAAGLQYINYGKFTETDIYGQQLGEFTAGDYALNVSFSKMLHSQILTGGTIKGIYSSMREYKSYGIAADLASTYTSKNNSFVAALVFKNMGAQIKSYTPNNREQLPFEVQLGVSKKIKFAPFRVILLARNLQKWDLTYNTPGSPAPEIDPLTGKEKTKFFTPDKLMRHFVLGVELSPVKAFSLRMGYNYEQQQEMKLTARTGLTGFSIGAGIRILKMNLSYARNAYHIAGASNHITLSVNISEFYTKK